MRFRMYALPTQPDFIIGTEIGLPTETIQPLPVAHLIVSFLPEHPFDFPPLAAVAAAMVDFPGTVGRLKEKFGAKRLTVLAPRPSFDAVPGEGVTVVSCAPEYPLTEERAAALAKNGKETFRLMGWFEWYTHLLRLSGKPLPGLPVSLSFPAEKKYFSGRMGKGQTLRQTLAALPSTPAWCGGADCLVLDHPFRGALVGLDAPLEEVKPYRFILLPKNKRQPVSLTDRVAAMLWEPRYRTFRGFYHSLPTLLGTPCQKCLHCVKICPAGIVPFMLSALFSREQIKEAVEFNPGACLECGLCSFVCPSGIPLLHSIKNLKKKAGIP